MGEGTGEQFPATGLAGVVRLLATGPLALPLSPQDPYRDSGIQNGPRELCWIIDGIVKNAGRVVRLKIQRSSPSILPVGKNQSWERAKLEAIMTRKRQ